MSDDMNDTSDLRDDAVENEMAQILRQATPRGADAALRSGPGGRGRPVACSPGRDGSESSGRRPPRRFCWALLNYWVAKRGTERLARIMGPPALSKRAAELAADIAAITDEATGRWAYERLAASCQPPNPLERSRITE